ncbi:hypothetical protein OJAV_G00193820 [Oryzias javanicus]|uniref:BLUF domain-containing protein n=1 Tax=Oryzias javanicus TaxID=123683 RepID=A0A3S2MIM6_ORYJA|nr:hypothetical protein OJAV_G00193820 [Oryzias javanicus]
MAASQKVNIPFSDNLEGEEEDGVTMLDVVWGQLREKVVLKQLIVIARCKQDLFKKEELGAYYENMIFQLSKQHKWDHITGLLLIYPFYMLHVIEAPSDILTFILKALKVEQEQPEGVLLEAKIAFVTQKLQSRLFQQWSYKKLGAQLESQKKVLPGSVLDKNPQLIVPQRVLEKLLGQEELLTPEQYLLMYNSPLNINIEFGETMSRSFLSTI